MKIPLVGESYALRSPAAAAQQSLNKYPQFIDDPDETGKNKGILVDTPGLHLMATLADAPVRGLWSGGGRLFAAGLTHIYELALNNYLGGNPSTGALSVVSDHNLLTSGPDPVQMFPSGDGNQLLTVKDGSAYCDNGAGPVLCRFQISGDFTTTDGVNLVWADGDEFPPEIEGMYGTFNGSVVQVVTWTDWEHITLSGTIGVQATPVPFSAAAGDPVTATTGAYLDGFFIVQRPPGSVAAFNGNFTTTDGTTIVWASGAKFTDDMFGQYCIFAGVSVVVAAYSDPEHVIVYPSVGVQAVAAPYSFGGVTDLGRQFNISAPDDGTNWDPLDFANKESYSDHLQSILADHEQLYLFGTESMEIWQNTGGPVFPFQRIPGAAAREGSAARSGPVAMAGKTYFIGGPPRGNPVAYRLDTFTPVRISTHAVEAAWANRSEVISEAVSFAYIEDGHQFWVVNFAGNLNTWVYDETASEQAGTPIWHQRAAWNGTIFLPYHPWFHTFIPEWGPSGMHVVGDYLTGKIWEMSLDYPDDDGADRSWVRILPHLYAGGLWQYFGRMTLEMETGTTASTTVEPTITRDYSDDRGNTFVNPVAQGYGLYGNNSKRVFWPSNGASRDRVYRFTGTGKQRSTLIDLELDVEVGTT